MALDRTTETAATTVLADLVSSGGGTYEQGTLLPFTPRDGFAVGLGGIHLPMAVVTADAVMWACKAVASEHEASLVGTWLHDGLVYFDAVRYYAAGRRDDAMRDGWLGDQQAIYDFAAREAVSTKGAQWDS